MGHVAGSAWDTWNSGALQRYYESDSNSAPNHSPVLRALGSNHGSQSNLSAYNSLQPRSSPSNSMPTVVEGEVVQVKTADMVPAIVDLHRRTRTLKSQLPFFFCAAILFFGIAITVFITAIRYFAAVHVSAPLALTSFLMIWSTFALFIRPLTGPLLTWTLTTYISFTVFSTFSFVSLDFLGVDHEGKQPPGWITPLMVAYCVLALLFGVYASVVVWRLLTFVNAITRVGHAFGLHNFPGLKYKSYLFPPPTDGLRITRRFTTVSVALPILGVCTAAIFMGLYIDKVTVIGITTILLTALGIVVFGIRASASRSRETLVSAYGFVTPAIVQTGAFAGLTFDGTPFDVITKCQLSENSNPPETDTGSSSRRREIVQARFSGDPQAQRGKATKGELNARRRRMTNRRPPTAADAADDDAADDDIVLEEILAPVMETDNETRLHLQQTGPPPSSGVQPCDGTREFETDLIDPWSPFDLCDPNDNVWGPSEDDEPMVTGLGPEGMSRFIFNPSAPRPPPFTLLENPYYTGEGSAHSPGGSSPTPTPTPTVTPDAVAELGSCLNPSAVASIIITIGIIFIAMFTSWMVRLLMDKTSIYEDSLSESDVLRYRKSSCLGNATSTGVRFETDRMAKARSLVMKARKAFAVPLFACVIFIIFAIIEWSIFTTGQIMYVVVVGIACIVAQGLVTSLQYDRTVLAYMLVVVLISVSFVISAIPLTIDSNIARACKRDEDPENFTCVPLASAFTTVAIAIATVVAGLCALYWLGIVTELLIPDVISGNSTESNSSVTRIAPSVGDSGGYVINKLPSKTGSSDQLIVVNDAASTSTAANGSAPPSTQASLTKSIIPGLVLSQSTPFSTLRDIIIGRCGPVDSIELVDNDTTRLLSGEDDWSQAVDRCTGGEGDPDAAEFGSGEHMVEMPLRVRTTSGSTVEFVQPVGKAPRSALNSLAVPSGGSVHSSMQSTDASQFDSSATQVPDDTPINWQLGDYIAQGTSGAVYQGLNMDSGAIIAVKVYHLGSSGMTDTDLVSFKNEIALMRRLTHENIVKYLGAESREGALQILMEFVSGGTLSSVVTKFKKLSESTVRMYTRQMLTGLHYLHQNGIIHRDLKGSNILVSTEGVVKLTDFGCSKNLNASWQTNGTVGGNGHTVVGTPAYIAPEVIRGEGAGRRSDVWSVGCTIIEMVSGRPPFADASNPFALMYSVGNLKTAPRLPEGMLSPLGTDFLSKCLEPDPHKRPYVTELLHHPWLTTASPQPSPAPSPQPIRTMNV